MKYWLKSYDEKHVVEMLETAKKVKGRKKLATKLQEQQIKYWLTRSARTYVINVLMRKRRQRKRCGQLEEIQATLV